MYVDRISSSWFQQVRAKHLRRLDVLLFGNFFKKHSAASYISTTIRLGNHTYTQYRVFSRFKHNSSRNLNAIMLFTKIALLFGCVWLTGALVIEPQSQSWMSTVWEILERMINTESTVKRLGEEMKRSQDDVTSALEELKSVNAEIKRAQDNVNAGLLELKNWNAEIQRARNDVTSG